MKTPKFDGSRFDDEIASREASLAELDMQIENAEADEADARADAIVGAKTSAEAKAVIDGLPGLIERRRVLALEIDGLTRRRAQAAERHRSETLAARLENDVHPAALEVIDCLHRLNAMAAEYGSAVKDLIDASHRATNAWPGGFVGFNQPGQFASSPMGPSGLLSELSAHLHALVSAQSGERLPYVHPPKIWPLAQSGGMYLANVPELVQRFGAEWVSLFENAAQRPDLAKSIREKIEGRAAKKPRKVAA